MNCNAEFEILGFVPSHSDGSPGRTCLGIARRKLNDFKLWVTALRDDLK